MPPSVKDIAAACGVSDVTVSRALNAREDEGTIRIGDETRSRIVAVAQELGYRPNRLARNLARGGSQIVGFVAAIPNDSFTASVMAGVQNVCKAHEKVLTLCPASHMKAEALLAIGEFLAQHGVDVIVVESYVSVDRQADVARELSRLAKRVVFVDQDIPGAHCVFSDDVVGMRSAVDYLISLGHKRIALACPDFSSTGQKRLQGYIDAMQGAGLDIDGRLVIDGECSEEHGRAAACKLLSLSHPPTAIVGANDAVAVGVMMELADRSISVPDEISLVGYSDLARTDVLGLTTVRQPAFEMGMAAAKLAIGHLPDARVTPIHKVLDASLVVRTSCAQRVGTDRWIND